MNMLHYIENNTRVSR